MISLLLSLSPPGSHRQTSNYTWWQVATKPMQQSQHVCTLLTLVTITIITAQAFALVQSPIASPLSSRRRNTLLYDGSIDVSDLGLTLKDLEAPLPQELFAITTSGTESTSRLPFVDDDGCIWEESVDTMDVTLSIPGLRGQPPAALSLDITKNTATITAFGMAVWSCILRGECDPTTVSFSTSDGNDMVPLIEVSVKKSKSGERWGGFIAQIGEDSIL